MLERTCMISGVTRALMGGGGGGCIFIYSCSAQRISFEMKLKTTDFKGNEYTSPTPRLTL